MKIEINLDEEQFRKELLSELTKYLNKEGLMGYIHQIIRGYYKSAKLKDIREVLRVLEWKIARLEKKFLKAK